MAEQYNDMFIRNNLADTGELPAQGSLCHSPDIIPNGTDAEKDPETTFKESWDKDVGKDLVANWKNYFYVRGKNLAAVAATGQVYLYYAQSNLLLYPSVWQNNALRTDQGADNVAVSAKNSGDIFVGDDAFTWEKVPKPGSGYHYCLIARVVTADHPNPIPTTGEIHSFATYIAENPAMAQRNVRVVDTGAPTFQQTTDYDQGTEGCEIYFYLVCTNVPVGAEVAFSCGSPGPDPRIDLPRTKVSNPHSFIVGIKSNVPADFKSNITYSYWANGTTPPPGWNIELQAVYIPPSGHENEKYCVPFEASAPVKGAESASVGPIMGICVGSDITVGK